MNLTRRAFLTSLSFSAPALGGGCFIVRRSQVDEIHQVGIQLHDGRGALRLHGYSGKAIEISALDPGVEFMLQPLDRHRKLCDSRYSAPPKRWRGKLVGSQSQQYILTVWCGRAKTARVRVRELTVAETALLNHQLLIA